jgi:hypothetical protein
MHRIVPVFAAVLAAACTFSPYQTQPLYYLAGQSCDPLVPGQCGYPFPSNVYLVDDPKTGFTVQFGESSLPVNDGQHTSPKPYTSSDGFSPGATLLAYFPGATATGLPTPDTIAASMTADSPTVIIEADTGARVPHWSEMDVSSTGGVLLPQSAFMIRPAIRLKDSTRYLVAIRKVVDARGALIAPSPAFQALRDGTSSSDESVTRRRELYADIFARLAKAGVSQKDLQLAWDFTTASQKNNTQSLVQMRDDALRVVGTDGPSYDIGNNVPGQPPAVTVNADGDNIGITMNPNSNIAMRIEGTFHVPLYLTQPNPPADTSNAPARLVRDTQGLPMQNGWADYPFIAAIPNSVANATNPAYAGPHVSSPAPILMNGHGLLGKRTEGENGYLDEIAQEDGYITIAVDMTGFDYHAVATSAYVLIRDIGNFVDLVDPQHQGFINELLAMRMMMGKFARDPRFFFNDQGQPDPAGHSVIDTTRRFYRGDSQGGIMGATYMSISTDVTRGYLGEPGFPYNLLVLRSSDFGAYLLTMQGTYPSTGYRDIPLVIGLMQMLWDRTEPDGYAPYLTQNPLPGTPRHDVIIADAIGDFQVTPYAAHLLARTIGAKNVAPVNRDLYGLAGTAGPFSGSGLIEFDFHLDQNPAVTLPLTDIGNRGPNSCDPHGKPRVEWPSIHMTDVFFRTGQIQSFCWGDSLFPAITGACEAASQCDNQSILDASCQSGMCTELQGSCDFDASSGHTTAPSTPSACGPG